MNLLLILAGVLALLGACIHGGVGQAAVLSRLSPETLPASGLGGPRMTKAMIDVSWHIVTVAFLTIGVALVLAGSVLDGDVARAVGVFSAVAYTGFAAIAVGLGAVHTGSARGLYRHPGPIAITATACLAWAGAL